MADVWADNAIGDTTTGPDVMKCKSGIGLASPFMGASTRATVERVMEGFDRVHPAARDTLSTAVVTAPAGDIQAL